MEVILIKPVRKLGKIGQVLKVKDGFGRNYLIPKNLAIRATKHNKELIEQQQHDLEASNLTKKLEAEQIASIIKNKEVTFVMQSSDDGKLFGSVGSKEIAKKLSDITNYNITSANIVLDMAIKSIGVFQVEITMHPEVNVHILVIVARSEPEAISLINNHSSYNIENEAVTQL